MMNESVSGTTATRKFEYVIIAIALMIGVVCAVTVYMLKPPLLWSPWLFKGAYARYHGETSVLFINVKIDMRFEVIDYNFTHAKILRYFKVESPFVTQEDQNTTWIDLFKKRHDILALKGFKLKRSYEQDIYIESFGTRSCIVYEYEDETSSQNTMLIYADKLVGLPLKLKLSHSGNEIQGGPTFSIEINLVETNIPGLKK